MIFMCHSYTEGVRYTWAIDGVRMSSTMHTINAKMTVPQAQQTQKTKKTVMKTS